jgi:hypothetical protein
MNGVVIGLSIIALILIYVLYIYFKKSPLTSGIIGLNAQTLIEETKLEKSTATNYYYEGWVFVQSPLNLPNKLFGRDIAFLLNNNTLSVYKGTTILFQVTDKFPIQKWVHLAMNVYNHSQTKSIIEIYINGKLVLTKPNQALTDSPVGSFVMGQSGGHAGYLTKVNRVSANINAEEVWNRYLEGNGVSGYVAFLSNYNVNLSVLKDNALERKIQLI